MFYKILKYTILSLFTFAFLFIFLPIGDFCNGLTDIIPFVIIGVLLIFFLFLFSIIDIFYWRKHKQNFDFITYIYPIIIISFFYTIHKTDNNKVWTSKIAYGIIEEKEEVINHSLKLYSNKTFSITNSQFDNSCTFQGDYILENDTLKLFRNVTELTDSVFTNQYILNSSDSVLLSVKNGFSEIKIDYWNLK